MNIAGIVVFIITYVLISVRRIDALGLDRASAAMLGATVFVLAGILAPEAAIDAIDGNTLILLLGVMGMGAFLVADGLFDVVEARLVPLTAYPHRLLASVVWGSGILSAFITNDAVCILVAPLLLRLCARAGRSPLPYLLGLATAANTGSVATLVGNPQNMLCGQLGALDYFGYARIALPLAVVGLAVNHGVIALVYQRALRQAPDLPATPMTAPAPPASKLEARHIQALAVIAITAVLYTVGWSLPWTAMGGFLALLLIRRPSPERIWAYVDGRLLLFFMGLFIVVAGVRESGANDLILRYFPTHLHLESLVDTLHLSAVFLLASNLVSNVPFILLIQDAMAALPSPDKAWTLLAVISTFAGNLTLLGSAANIIVAESARAHGGISFMDHLKVGAPIALLTSLMGWLWVTAIG